MHVNSKNTAQSPGIEGLSMVAGKGLVPFPATNRAIDYRVIFGERYWAALRPVTTSKPVCAQNAPFSPSARFAAVGQLVQ